MAGWRHRLQPVFSSPPPAFPSRDCQGAVRSARRRLVRDLYSAVLILALTVAATACKARHDRVTVQNEEETAPRLATLVRMNDPKTSAQMLSGFYGLENNTWRWTSGNFSVLLRPPPGSRAQGGVLTFDFTLPDVVIQKLKAITITASVNGMKLKSARYDKPGVDVFSADVPPALLDGDTLKVDFALDKTIPPDVDKRNLGVIATSIGLSGKE